MYKKKIYGLIVLIGIVSCLIGVITRFNVVGADANDASHSKIKAGASNDPGELNIEVDDKNLEVQGEELLNNAPESAADEDGDDGDDSDDGDDGDDDWDNVYKHKPSPPPLRALGMVFRGGFILQPLENMYVRQSRSITMKSKFIESIWDRLSGVLLLRDQTPNYRWYYSTDKENWTMIAKESKREGKKKTYLYKAKKVGTYYYQVRASSGALLNLFRIPYYSRVSAVHVIQKDVDAEDFKVTLDDDYIYNMDNLDNVTFARENVTPHNATGNVTWSGDNEKLAKVDKITGEIVGNTRGLSGDVRVTGVFTNSGNGIKSDTKVLRVGGGLDDQTVQAGETATFELFGVNKKELPEKYWIEWHDKTHKEDIVLEKEQNFKLKIEPTGLKDDKRKIYAKVIVKDPIKDKEHSFKTRVANLWVLSAGEPNIEIKSKIENESYTESNGASESIDKVLKGDKLTITSDLENISNGTVLNFAEYKLPLHTSNTKKDIISVQGSTSEGAPLKNIKYHFNDSDKKHKYLQIEDLKFEDQTKMQIVVQFKINGVHQKETFVTQPTVEGTPGVDPGEGNDDDEMFREYFSNEIIVHFINNEISITAGNISFGEISSVTEGQLLNRVNYNDKNSAVVEIDDQRRNKKEHQIKVKQESQFMDQSTKTTIPVSLRYYKSDGSFTSIDNNYSDVPKEDLNIHDNIDSVCWNKDCGVLMHIDDANIPAGSYSTVLTWTSFDVP
ncbi:hypothetical protein [Companilactobacillus jidongensis]|uniref:hypothetical protein n=1 Tax=Companilactobacillus jidongensis TaxID=2486006 RepID=UPI000F78DF09|nr:hypothetical protein [Companilactobacillus jidongensis]